MEFEDDAKDSHILSDDKNDKHGLRECASTIRRVYLLFVGGCQMSPQHFYSSRRRCLGTIRIFFFFSFLFFSFVVGTLNEIPTCVSVLCVYLCILLYKFLYTCIHVCIVHIHMSLSWLKHFSDNSSLFFSPLAKKLRSKKTQLFANFQKTQVKKVPKSGFFALFYYISFQKTQLKFRKTQGFEYFSICWYSEKWGKKSLG